MTYRVKIIITISLLIAMSVSIGGTILIVASCQKLLQEETNAALDSYETMQNTFYLLRSYDYEPDEYAYVLPDTESPFEPRKLEQTLMQMTQLNSQKWQALSLKLDSHQVAYSGNENALTEYSLPEPESNMCSYMQVEDKYGYGLIILGGVTLGGKQLWLEARFDLSKIYETRNIQLRLFTIVYGIVLFFGVITAIILSNVLTSRLRRLTAAVRQIASGDLSTRSHIFSEDEFGQLSRDLDAMADKLQENFNRLENDIDYQENFMGAVAHELKTPMTSIIGYSDLLRQGNLDESTRIMAAEYIHSEGHRLERLSFKLLDLLLLKKDNVVMKRLWLSSFLSDVEKALAPQLKAKGIRLICKGEQSIVAFEPDLVKSLLYNLIDNATKAMDGEGIVAVKGTAIPGGCQFQVVDNGRGMEKSELTKITEAFYRVDKARSRSQGGAGLGLALCKQIVELHNGTIQFNSTVGKGTKVTVTLYGKAGKADA